MNSITEKIKAHIKIGTVLPKPKAKSEFHFLGWCISGNEEAISYSIPNHKDPQNPYKKYIRKSELEKSYGEFVKNGYISRQWFKVELSKLAKKAPCSFTTIGGILVLLGEATYEQKLARYVKND